MKRKNGGRGSVHVQYMYDCMKEEELWICQGER